MKRAEKQLIQALATASAVVGYEAFGDEPVFDEYLRGLRVELPVYRTSPDKNAPPEEALQSISVLAGAGDAVIFLPGRMFDKTGTRHGRGGGWYDRFLSAVPEQWTRVGVTREEQISETALERKPWDEPVDFILVHSSNGWEVIETPRRLRKT